MKSRHFIFFTCMFIVLELFLLQADFGEVRGSYVDVESSVNNSFRAWISFSSLWIQTLQSDFNAGVCSDVDVSTSSGDVKLSRQGSVYGLWGDSKYDFWRYNISNDSWISLRSTLDPVKEGGALTYDGNNYIYVLRGGGNIDFWRYGISSDNWTSMSNAPGIVSKGGALVFGGNDSIYALSGENNLDFWRYSISSDSWTSMSNAPANLEDGGNLVYDGHDHIYAMEYSVKAKVVDNSLSSDGKGHEDVGKSLNFWCYNISSNSWRSLNVTPLEVDKGGTFAYGNNYLYVLRGNNQNFWRYNISSGVWDTMAALPETAKEEAGLAYDGGNYLYAVAGSNGRMFYRYNISSNFWSQLTSAPAIPAWGSAIACVEIYKSNGSIASQVLDTGSSGMKWSSLEWGATLESGTNITFEVRASDASFAKENSSLPWVPAGGTFPVYSGLPSGRYMQWRATLTTTEPSKTPVLHDVSIYYSE